MSRKTRHRKGFTLLEVCLGVAIIALIVLSLYRFLELNLRAIAMSTQQSNEEATLTSISAVIQSELNRLPQASVGSLLGDNHIFKELASDELSWLTSSGNGLFTKHAQGEYRVRLMLKPLTEKSSELEMGLRRQSTSPESDKKAMNWIRLLPAMKALEFRYFDPRLNAWLEKWTDQNARPALVRMRLWRANDEVPYEAIFSIPRTTNAEQAQQPQRPRGRKPGP